MSLPLAQRVPRETPDPLADEPLDRLEAAIVFAMQRAAKKHRQPERRAKMTVVDGGRRA